MRCTTPDRIEFSLHPTYPRLLQTVDEVLANVPQGGRCAKGD